jgi:hypothetical protein
MADGEKLVLNLKSGEVRSVPLTAREIEQRTDVQKAVGAEIKKVDVLEQQRQDDIAALETASADQIGRIIARLLRA